MENVRKLRIFPQTTHNLERVNLSFCMEIVDVDVILIMFSITKNIPPNLISYKFHTL